MNRGSCEHVYAGAPIKGFIVSEPAGRRKPRPVDLCAGCFDLVKSAPRLHDATDRRKTGRGTHQHPSRTPE